MLRSEREEEKEEERRGEERRATEAIRRVWNSSFEVFVVQVRAGANDDAEGGLWLADLMSQWAGEQDKRSQRDHRAVADFQSEAQGEQKKEQRA